MAGEWEEKTLGELCSLITDGKHGDCQNDHGSGFYFLSVKDVFGDRMVYDNARQITEADFAETHRRTNLEPGDILFTNTGTIGRMAIAPDDPKTTRTTFQKSVAILKPKQQIVISRFLYFTLRFDNARLSDFAAGTTQKNLLLKDLRAFTVRIPPLAEQKAIAAVLGALDDKIELNRRMNATLETMARALFQSWFVDFDPVRAKLDGRQPVGMDEATAGLFPDSFEDSELGPIPHGWTATTLGETCMQGGGNIQTGPFGTQLHASDYVDEGIPSIMPSDLRDNRIDTSSIARIHMQDAERLKMYRVQTGDVVYSRRGDVERRSLIRRSEDGWLCGTGCLRVRFGSRGLNPYFGASYLGTLESRAWVIRHAVGATMPNLNTSIFSALPIIVPPPELQAHFAGIGSQWDERGTIALEESRTLATLRDTLLPNLLSQKLQIQL